MEAKFNRFRALVMGLALAAFMFAVTAQQSFAQYVVPDDLIDSNISAANQTAVASQLTSNGAVLTLILMALGGALFGLIMTAIRKAKRA